MDGGVLNVADHLRIYRPWIGAPGGEAEIANGSGDRTARKKITSLGQTSNGSENCASEALRKAGNQVAEAMKRQGDSVFNWAEVHSVNPLSPCTVCPDDTCTR
jgi:hypothetical protein